MSLDSILRSNPNKVTIPSDSKNLITYPYKETTHDIGSTHFTVGADGSIKVEGSTESTITFIVSQSITLTPNTQYVLSGYREGSSVSYMVLRDTDTRSQVIKLTRVNQTQAFTASHSTYELYIQLDANTTTEDYDLYYPQLEEGTTATEYELNTGSKEVLKVSYGSRNLIPYPYYTPSSTVNNIIFTVNADGSISFSGTSTGQATFYFVYGAMNLKQGVTYTLSASGNYSFGGSATFYIYDSTQGQSAYIPLLTDTSATFTPTRNINNTNCYLVIPTDRTVSGTFYPQLEIGDKATEYVPYSREVVWTKA